MKIISKGQASGVPGVSVIIPNLNSPIIHRTLHSLLSQSAFNHIVEILVVGLDEPNLVPLTPPVRFINTDSPVSAPVARNIGIRQAQGDLLAFIDSDCLASPDWIRCLVNTTEKGHPIVGGSVSLARNNYYQLCYNLSMFHEFLENKPPGLRPILGTLNLMVSRRVVEKTGLLNETLPRSQDVEWTLRMRREGYRLYFEPRAVVNHIPEIKNLRQILKTWYKTGYYSSQIRHHHKDLIRATPLFKVPLLLSLFSPLIGLAVTLKLLYRNVFLLLYPQTLPVIYLTKIFWCLGAAASPQTDNLSR